MGFGRGVSLAAVTKYLSAVATRDGSTRTAIAPSGQTGERHLLEDDSFAEDEDDHLGGGDGGGPTVGMAFLPRARNYQPSVLKSSQAALGADYESLFDTSTGLEDGLATALDYIERQRINGTLPANVEIPTEITRFAESIQNGSLRLEVAPEEPHPHHPVPPRVASSIGLYTVEFSEQ